MKSSAIESCNCMALRRAARRASQMYDEALAPAALRATQFSILAMLHAASGLSVNDLATRLELDRTTTGKNLRPLERDGLLAVAVARDDRRSRVIALTEAGRARLTAAFPLWAAAQERFEEENGRKRSRELRVTLGQLKTSAAQ